MLDGLDEIDWGSLHHASGPADDVPDLIRGLVSPKSGKRSKALYELFGNIWHQGTVYEASPFAAVFLIELAADASVPNRDQILQLLHGLATGHSAKWAAPTRAAVAAGENVFRRLLADANPTLRMAAAHTLSALLERRDELGPVLRDAAARETDADARAGMLLSVALLADASPQARALFDERLAAPADEREQLFAAVGLIAALGPDAPPTAADVLAQAAIRPRWWERCASGLPWDALSEVRPDEWLAKVGPRGTARALPVLVDGLRRMEDPVDASFIVDALLATAFPDGKAPAPGAMTGSQRAVVRAIADADVAWQSPGLFVCNLELHGLLPRALIVRDAAAQRAAVRRLLEEPDPMT